MTSKLNVNARTRDIKLWDDKVTSVDLAPLRNLPKLRNVFIRSSGLESLDLSPLAGTPIEELRLVLPKGLAITLPAKCRALAHLIISGGPESLDLSPIATSPLEELLVFDSPLTEIDLAPLARCKQLEIIWLRRTKLRALDLRPLAALPMLRALELSGSKLAAVTATSGFEALEYLHLHDNPLTKLDLSAFRSLPTSMKVLNLPVSLRGIIDVPARKKLEVAFRGRDDEEL